jgi:hypothetical protein
VADQAREIPTALDLPLLDDADRLAAERARRA